MFPLQINRRLRVSESIRSLVRDTSLSPTDFMLLIGLPPQVQWVYDHHPEKGSEEEKLVEVLENPKEWI